MEFTPEAIAIIVAAVISLMLEVVPGLSAWWDGKVGGTWKPLILLGLSLVTPLAIVGLSCAGVDLGYGALCPDPGSPQLWINAVLIGLLAFGTTQATFRYIGEPLGARVSAKRTEPKAVG